MSSFVWEWWNAAQAVSSKKHVKVQRQECTAWKKRVQNLHEICPHGCIKYYLHLIFWAGFKILVPIQLELIKGSLEIKSPTTWRDEMQKTGEKSQKKENTGAREMEGKSPNIAFFQ